MQNCDKVLVCKISLKYTVLFKSYEYFYLNTSTGKSDAQQMLLTILHTSDWRILK